MCGFLFSLSDKNRILDHETLKNAFYSFSWRGPDNHQTLSLREGRVFLGHHRLSIIEPTPAANQPMLLSDGKTYLLFNGEIYNHLELRKELSLVCKTNSDSETIGEAYLKIGDRIFEKLDGMFAIVIYDSISNSWTAVRDAFGIKPLFISQTSNSTIICSEASAIAKITGARPSEESLREWELIRRPVPGYSFFQGVNEIEPGKIVKSSGQVISHWRWEYDGNEFGQKRFEELLTESVLKHELSDCENVSLLSGGLDSALIAKLNHSVNRFYTVGLENHNEFEGAAATSSEVKGNLSKIGLTSVELEEIWKQLTCKRGEPLSLPNEGLIYKVCSEMNENEKVVLTGEGADELLFGYDKIFRWAVNPVEFNYEQFISRYGYSTNYNAARLKDYFYSESVGKKPIEFLEDFFYKVHLPGLLRRMDFASMAASKEARVPFVSKDLISYSYRKPANIKISENGSKLPIREFARKLGLNSALSRKKIGFSAKLNKEHSRFKDYKVFQTKIIEALGWS